MIVSEWIRWTSEALGRGLSRDAAPNSPLGELFEQTYGRQDLLIDKLELLRRQCGLFIQAYGDGPLFVLRSPARINLLGEHVDYVSYLPTASLTFGSREHEMIMLCRPAQAGRVRGSSSLPGCDSLTFDLAEAPAGAALHENGREWTHFLYLRSTPAPHWGNYVRGAVYFARMKYGERVSRGFDFLLDSSIPSAGGASSSSALTVLAGAAIRRANHVPCDALELAHDSARAEWFVGTRGGTMDHLTMCLSRRGRVVHLRYQKDESDLLPMTHGGYRLVTFYAHPADKGREVMLEYNERAAVARILIPAILEDWAVSRPALHASWLAEMPGAEEPSLDGQRRLGELLSQLPEAMSLREAETRYPAAFGMCAEAFDALVRDRLERPLRIRDRALHHLGEVSRVAEAVRALRSLDTADPSEETDAVDAVMRRIGGLLNQSHTSLRDLYGVSTPQVDRLIDAVAADPMVYGARLMGGGFGGNVLVLTGAGNVRRLVDHVQERCFEGGAKDGTRRGRVMISTPGDGVAALDPETAGRHAVENVNENWRCAGSQVAHVRGLLAQLIPHLTIPEVRPIILAAGKGERARKSGLGTPKPLAPVLGTPAVLRVLRAVNSACRPADPPVVIVSPETEVGVREALAAETVAFVLQPASLGTGDAILCAADSLGDFRGRALVVWGTQPVITPETVRLAIGLAALFQDYEMVLPTTVMEKPYAPLYRDAGARITAAHETHLEHMHVPEFGETNIGLFLVWTRTMLAELGRLRREFWRESESCYARPRGELGFPNELIRALAGRAGGVMACPIADWREEKGIKSKADLARCERYIRELASSET